MTLNKSERHIAYIIMLCQLEDKNVSAGRKQFCIIAWDLWLLDIDDSEPGTDIAHFFPELGKKKPSYNYTGCNSYWFSPEEGVEPRINLLKQCIAETA